MKRIKLSIINNTIIFILVTFATVCMFTDFHFMESVPTLSAKGLVCFKYFTVDSNIFIGLMCFITTIYEILYIKKKVKNVPKTIYILKYMATTAVALTFFVTLFYLGPRIEKGFFSLYTNANLFFHLIVPVLAMVGYVFFDKYNSKFKDSFYALIPVILYSFFYIPNVLTHMVDGKATIEYDFYGFFYGNPYMVLASYPLILFIVFLLAAILNWLNNKMLKK